MTSLALLYVAHVRSGNHAGPRENLIMEEGEEGSEGGEGGEAGATAKATALVRPVEIYLGGGRGRPYTLNCVKNKCTQFQFCV